MKKFTKIFALFLGMMLSTLSTSLIAQCSAGETYNSYCYGQGEVNNVAFEFCPTSGSIAQSTIIAGSVGNAFPAPPGTTVPNNLTVYEGTSGTGIGGSIIFGPASSPGGNFSGTVMTATAPDLCLIFVFNSIPASLSCQDGFDALLEVCSENLAGTTVTFTAPADLCINAGVQTGLGGGSPTGGVYSGPGVTDNGNGTYDFDPAAAGVGTHTLTYTNGGAASDDVEVFAVPIVTFTALADLCIDAGLQTGLGSGSPTGGIYSGPGVTDNGNGSTYSFDPAAAGLGVHTITYTEPSTCMSTGTDMVEILAACGCPPSFSSSHFHCSSAPEASLVVFEVCPSAGMAAQATIMQGTYSAGFGNSLSVYEGTSGSSTGGTLVAGPLSGDLTGTVIMGNGTDNCLIFVNTVPAIDCSTGGEAALKVCGEDIASSITFTALADLCIDAGVQTGLGGGSPIGGVYSGSGVTDDGNGMTYSFDPAAAGAGVHTLTYTESNSTAMDDVEVFALGTAGCVSFIALDDLCIDAGVQTNLIGGLPTGGVYSGTGVTDDGNGLTYSFDPATAGAGVPTLTYTAGGFPATDDVEVFAIPAVTLNITTNNQLCLTSGVTLYTLTATPAGGVFSGTGVTNLGDGSSFTFNPSIAGLGTHTVTYTFTDANGCTGMATDDIEVVTGPTITFTALADLCIDAGVQTGLGSGTPTSGVYSGPGVTDDGNGTTYSFDPAAAGAGTHTILYSYDDGLGCTGTASDDVEVFALPTVMFTAPTDLCFNAGTQAGLSGGTPMGGVYGGSGVTDDGNGMTYSFNPISAGVGTHTLTYDFIDTNGCNGSATDEVEVLPLPNATLNITNDQLCLNAGVTLYTLTATPTGGVFSGAGVTNLGDGISFTFDPAAAGVGVHVVTYSFIGGNGCTGTETDDIEILALPTVMFTAPADLCVDEGVQAGLGSGTPTGGIYSGMGVTDDANGMTYSFDPAAAGVGTHPLTYTFTGANGCTNSANDDVEVFALPTVMFTAPADLCIDAGVQAGLGGGTPMGGVYSGPGVTDDGNGMTYSFDPAAAGLGSHIITYDFTDANGCSGSASDNVEVEAKPAATFMVSDISGCEGNGTCVGTSTLITPVSTTPTNLFKFYDADPAGGIATLIGGPAASFDPMTTAATSPQSVWIVECLPGACDSEAEEVVITIVTNPTPTLMTPAFPTSLTCQQAEVYIADPATFTNGLTGACENSGSVSATLIPAYSACGGNVKVLYNGTDNCGNSLSAGPFTITVDPAPPVTTTVPTFPATLDCEMASVFTAADLTFENGIATGPCSNSGSIQATVNNTASSCLGGTITITYSGTDNCGNAISEGPFSITVTPPPPAVLTAPTLPTTLSCVMAEAYIAPDATYNNGLTGNCENSGNIVAVTTPSFDNCGGTISVSYTGMDDCGNMLSAGPFTITVDPAPAPIPANILFIPSLSCADADAFVAPTLPYSNNLTGTCNISGTIPPTVINAFDACGGTITISYDGQDECGNILTAGPFIIIVDPAPVPTVTTPTYSATISCTEAASFIAPNANYTNNLIGICNISGTLAAGVDNNWNACGGTIVLHYFGFDVCGNFLSIPSITIVVQPAPIPTITLPALPGSVSCADAGTYTPPTGSYNNGLPAACNISGSVSADVNQFFDACGGTLEIIYHGTDDCGRNLAAMVAIIPVDPAPAPTLTLPSYPSTLTCGEAYDLVGIIAPYSNGMDGDCKIDGLLEPTVLKIVDACTGGTVTINYSGTDDCGNILSATPIVIPVTPADAPSIQLPDDPNIVYCWDANNFSPGMATFSNGENGFCENSGELNLSTVEHLWTSCDGGFIVYQYSGYDNCGNYLETDVLKVAVLPDDFAPQGVCVDLNITLDDIKDIPAPNELAYYQNQIASSYYETCGNVNVNLVSDSGFPECGLDGTFERVYEFEITDDCGNSAGICSITFSGNCNPLYCTLTQDFYASETEQFAGFTAIGLITELIDDGNNPITVGTGSCGLTLDNAACIQGALAGAGQSISLPADYNFTCGDPLNNNLANQVITIILNIRYNAQINGSGLDYGNFQLDAACMYIPQSISTGLPANATINDLIDYANNFIGCQCSNTCGAYQDVQAELTGILLGLNSRFNKCHVPGPCFLDGNGDPNGGIVIIDVEKEIINTTGETTATEEILESKNSNVTLFPNPADQILNLEFNDNQMIGKSGIVEIFNVQGVKVGEKTFDSLDKEILQFDIHELVSGMYWLSIKMEGVYLITKKFLVTKRY